MPKIAICYWGMTRSTRFVYPSHYANLFNVLKENGAEYDVYLHTWKTDHNYIWSDDIPIKNDYTEHNFLNPTAYQIDNQDEFLNTINFNDYYYPNTNREWIPELIRNYICALESQKRCFNMCVKSNIKYDFVIFVRPDVLLTIKLPYKEIFEHKLCVHNSIVVPTDDWFEGYNDRFAIIKFDNAYNYINRINELVYYRKNIDYIVSEKYTKYIIDKYYNLQTIYFPFKIIRPNGLP